MRFRLIIIVLIGAMTCRAGEPTAVFDVSATFFRALVERDSETIKPIRTVILGADISGSGLTKSKSGLELVTDPNRLSVDVVITGTTWTDTIGYQGPVRVVTNREICFEARQRAFIELNGVTLGEPCAKARGEAQLRCIYTKYNGLLDALIKPIARRKYEKQKEEAGFIADRQGEDRYKEDLSEDLQKRASELSGQLARGLATLAELGLPRESLHVRTLPGAARLSVSAGPAAPTPPPAADNRADISARVHEAALNHLLPSRLAGRNFTEGEVEELIASRLGSVAGARREKHDNDPDWSLTLDKSEPVVIRFAEGSILARFRVAVFAVGDTIYQTPMDVTSRFEFVPSGGRLALRRVGKIEANPAGYVPGPGSKLSGRQIALRSVVEKQLNDSVPQRLELRDLPLQGGLERAGPLRLVGADAQGGWLTAAFQRVLGSR